MQGEEDEAERVALVDEEGEPAAADPGRRGPGLWPFGGRKGRRPQYVELSDSLGSGELDGVADLAPEGTPRGRWCPEEEAGWVSRTGFFWVSGLLQKGSEKHLEADDLVSAGAERTPGRRDGADARRSGTTPAGTTPGRWPPGSRSCTRAPRGGAPRRP